MENEEELVVLPHIERVEDPESCTTDMVELLTLVVDDLCVQVRKLREELKNAKD